MAVLTRLLRLARADAHGVMDRMEDRGLLLRQHLREMESALDGQEARLRGLAEAREEAERRLERLAARAGALSGDLDLALSRGKDDLGRTILARLLPLEREREALAARRGDLARQEERLAAETVERRAELDRLRAEVRSRLGREAGEGDPLSPVWSDPDREADAARIEVELLRRKEALGLAETVGTGEASS